LTPNKMLTSKMRPDRMSTQLSLITFFRCISTPKTVSSPGSSLLCEV
jgi:hypothetical protein